MPLLELRDFRGLHTNADPTDIDPRFLRRLENMIARMGRIRHSFAPGYYGTTITKQEPAYQVKNLAHYAHDALFGEHAILSAQISPRSNHLHLDSSAGGNPNLTADKALVLGFNEPYEAPSGATFTLASTHAISQTGSQTVNGVITGLVTDTSDDLYFGDYHIGIYDFADILYDTLSGSYPAPYDLTAANVTSGTWSTTRTLFAGVKVVRLEKILWEQEITAASTSASLNTATVMVSGRRGMEVNSGEIEGNVSYWVTGGTVTYNGTAYAAGSDFTGSDDEDEFTAASGAQVWRNLVIGDEFWIINSSTDDDGIQRVLSASYNSTLDETTITLRDAMTNDTTGADVRCIFPVAEAYNDRDVPRTYDVPRTTHTERNQLFAIIGYRNFIYGHAVSVCALTAFGDQTNAEAVIATLMTAQYPLATSGVHGPGVADGNFPFSCYVHGYSLGKYLRGSDPVTNGTFDSGSNWTAGGNWSIGSGVASHVSDGTTDDLTQANVFKAEHAGMTAVITFDCTAYTQGSFTPYAGSTAGTEVTGTGTNLTQSIVIDGTDLIFRASADGVFSIDNVSVEIRCNALLAPDPYFRTGASAWVGMAMGFFLEKFPGSSLADSVEESAIYLLDHLCDTYLISESGHPHEHRFRGGKGWYDYLDPAYTWHPDRIIKWISTEHNVDMWWFLKWAEELSWTSISGHDFGELRLRLEERLLADRGAANDYGHWWPDARRALQGGIAITDVQGISADNRLVVRGDATASLAAGTDFEVHNTAEIT